MTHRTSSRRFGLEPTRSLLVGIALAAAACSNPFDTIDSDFAADQFELIPAGSFVMGSANGRPNEAPPHSVTISREFYMQRTEITKGQWRSIMGSDPSSGAFAHCKDDCPVESVSWDDAQEFIDRLNAQDPGKGYRLPTEAEWEYAARAGTTGPFGGTGDPFEMGNTGGGLDKVAQRLPNDWGLYDMHGNVWEWVQDWYDFGYYQSSPSTDPPGPSGGTERVQRGGSWGNFTSDARSAVRRGAHPGARYNWVGFRLARDAS